MGRIGDWLAAAADWVQTFALALGAPGLFIVAFLDSSILSLPEVNDLLLVFMVTQHKARMPLYAASSTAGSIAGCLFLYYIGRKGGDAFVRRRFKSASVDHALEAVQRYGMMAVIIPSLLPPPAPFKIFVLLAGIAGISATRFSIAVAVGRGARYFGEGLLALWYGDAAVAFLRENARNVSVAVAVLVAAAFAGYLLWVKSQRSRSR
jgi:membrane protein YqaA with SNARE-associated domain